MKKFSDIKYERPNYEEIKVTLENLISRLKEASNVEEFLKIVKEIIGIQNKIEEMYDYADINNMRALDDEFYKKEIEYWNAFKTKFDLLFKPFYQIMLETPYKDQLIGVIPENFFNSILSKSKITSDDIVELKQKENELKSEYRNLNKATIMFDGEKLTLPKISMYFTSNDRNMRKKAHDAINEYYYTNAKKYTHILYELIQVRNEIAKKLGFNDTLEYSLHNLRRFGYDYKDIDLFRNNIIKYFSPLCKRINDIKKEELGLDKIEYYDTVSFKESPESLYKNEELLNHLKEVFTKIDSNLGEFYSELLKNGYIDFCTRENKVNFSITNYLVCECLPVITGNYKGNYKDVLTTTHEIGHAYQKYIAGIEDKNHVVSSLLKYPTFEIAEMFSHAMQLIATNYVDSIFSSDDLEKYGFIFICNLITTMPYICLIDEFQETIYKKKDLKEEDIGKIFIELSKKYKIYDEYIGNKNLEAGNYYFRQTHVYSDPFYYIDYALSYFGAFAIWNKSKKNLDLFKKIAAVASYYPFKKIIELYDMPNPFTEDAFKDVSIMLNQKIDEFKLTRKR